MGKPEKGNAQTPPVYQGQPGPQESRQCRDIFFLILFILFWGGMAVIAGFAIFSGDINRLRYGSDYLNNTCGIMNLQTGNRPSFDATNLKYLYYSYQVNSTTWEKMCVNECPKAGNMSALNFICRYGVSIAADESTKYSQVMNGSCSPVLFNSKPVLNRCVPTGNLTEIANFVLNGTSFNSSQSLSKVYDFVADDLNGRANLSKIYQSVAESWRVILGMAFAALAISFAWLILLNRLGGFMVWTTVFIANVATGGLAGFLFYNWHESKQPDPAFITTGTQLIDTKIYNEQTLLVLACIFGGIFALIFLISCAARRRISLAIQVIKETSVAIRAMPSIVFFPIIKYIALGLLFAWFVFIYALLSTSGTAVSNNIITKIDNTDVVDKFFVPTPERLLQFLQIYYILGLFWTWNWILAIWQCTIAGSIATWYWTRDKKAIPDLVVFRSFWRCFRYHLGSLAFGSLIIALVQLIRYLLLRLQQQLKASNNKVAQYITTCLQCFFACLERFLMILNKNAYIEIAVYGYSFCEAARTAFDLLVRNAFRVAVLDKVGDFLLFLGKLLITVVTTIIGLVILQRTNSQLGEFYAVPLIFIAVEAWFISSFFMSVLDMAIDTIFLCFCEDCERNDGTAQKPYFASESLRAFADKHKAAGAPDIGKENGKK